MSTGNIVIVQDADLEYDPADWPTLLEPILDGRADACFGSRFLGGPHRVLYYWHSVGNNVLTTYSNMLTNLNLTDMETCYKAMRGELARSLLPTLTAERFGFEPEITARLARSGARIFEVPISYSGRTYAEGKKIGWRTASPRSGTSPSTTCCHEYARSSRWAAPAIALLALASSAIGIVNQFTYDDRYIIEKNPVMHDLLHWWRAFASSYWPRGLGRRRISSVDDSGIQDRICDRRRTADGLSRGEHSAVRGGGGARVLRSRGASCRRGPRGWRPRSSRFTRCTSRRWRTSSDSRS